MMTTVKDTTFRSLSIAAIIIGLIAIAISGYSLMRPIPSYPHPAYYPTTRTITVTMVERNIWLSPELEENVTEPMIVGRFRRWQPNSITVFKGDTVVLTVKNKAEKVHSLVLLEFDVDTGDLEPLTGEKTVTFIADRTGFFKFMCAVPYDLEAGRCDPDHSKQVGYLSVLELEFELEEEGEPG